MPDPLNDVHLQQVSIERLFDDNRERSLLTARLRADILSRDRSRCQRCGASAADGATLHIDHIIPVSRGGLTVPDNLQTLCASCNLGKSNRYVG
jgi:5-methylcytosine-specific restriction endonuclease McrA